MSANPAEPPLEVDPVAYAQSFIDHGIPVVVCRPNPSYGKDPKASELYQPAGWSLIRAEDCDLSGYRAGIDTLAMVAGHGVDVVDVDTKDDGSIDHMPSFQRFGEHRTPSGGGHYFVRSTGFGKVAGYKTNLGFIGDYAGGTRDGGGRLLLYLPGSARPKYPDSGYEVVEPMDWDAWEGSEPDPNVVATLVACEARKEGKPGKPAAKKAEVEGFLAEHATEPERLCTYGRVALAKMLEKSHDVVEGDPTKGRHGWALRVAPRAVELVRGGCMWTGDLDTLGERLAEMKPEEDWHEALAWAVANADGETACGLHNPRETDEGGDVEGAAPLTEFEKLVRRYQLDMQAREEAQRRNTADKAVVGKEKSRLVDGEIFLFEEEEMVPVLWGHGDQCLWARGESLMIAGTPGAGKSTIAQQLVLAMLGCRDAKVVAWPVEPLVEGRVLYLAMDRPKQIRRSMRRMVKRLSADERKVLKERLVIHEGPLPVSITDPKNRDWLADYAESVGAKVVVIDSMKDVMAKASDDAEGSAYNSARQEVLTRGIDVLELHHQRKSGSDNKKPSKLDDVYGSRWLTAGAGSVLMMYAEEGGSPVVETTHVKSPMEAVLPFDIGHDHPAGYSTLFKGASVETVLSSCGTAGITARELAVRLYDTAHPTPSKVQSARNRAKRLVDRGQATAVERAGTTYYVAALAEVEEALRESLS